ncbi:DUF5337 domain-containing protein [Lacimonas salitolerans]|uniref:DUF5337 domain-containing protein n=1 Tax=Lacimonas salitolerans TaxID=1323750 RepID=A0ABW4EGE5_9RHOB
MTDTEQQQARKGRIAALVIAGTGVFWVLANLIGAEMGWSMRVRALFDLIALAGFVLAIAMIYQIWRARQKDQG